MRPIAVKVAESYNRAHAASTDLTIGGGNGTGMSVQRRLAAILAADVVGYSRLMGADEVGTLAELKGHRKDFIEPKIAEHHGRIVKLMGDGVLVEFASVVDAVECAAEIQRGMAERNAYVPEDRRIAFRIGINIGDVIIEGEDIYGEGVNVAARLQGLAKPGGVCVSGTVYDQIEGKLALSYEFLGKRQVKNIAKPVRVYSVSLDQAGGAAVAQKPSRFTSGPWPSMRRRSGRNTPRFATDLNNLALLYRDQGKYAEAEPLYKRALAIREKALGPEHPQTVLSFNNLALLYFNQGRYAEAEPLYQRALAIREKTLGPAYPRVATTLNNLAALYDTQGRYAEAEPLYQRALAIWEKTVGPDHPDVAAGLNNLAELYHAQGRYAEAEPLYQRSLVILENHGGQNPVQ